MAAEPQRHPYPKVFTSHRVILLDAITELLQSTSKEYVDALFALVSGALVYQGTWDASTNTPTLADGTGTTGHFYAVTVSGTQDLGSGNITFTAGDRVIHNGTIWQKWDTNDLITSVFTRTGDIVANVGDYTHAQIGSIGANDHHAKYTDAEALLAAWANIDTKNFENLLVDGNFEASEVSSFWTGVGSTTKAIEGTIVKIGTQAVKLSVPAPIPTVSYIYQDVVDFTRYQGRKVTLNVWARCPSGNSFDSMIEIDDGVGVTTSSVIPKDDTWHLMSITHTVDAAASQMRAILYLRKATETSMTDVAYFDGCMFVEGDSGVAYGDCSPLYQDITGIFRGAIALAGVLPVDADIATWNTKDRGFGKSFGIGRQFLIYKDVGGVRYKELSNDGIVSIDNGDSPYPVGVALKTNTTILCDATGGAIVVELPGAAKYDGVIFRIKKTDNSANTVTITPNGIETIDGAASKVLSTQYENIELLGDGTGWIVLYPTPFSHGPSHKDGGFDELDVAELAGGLGGAGEIPETDGAAVAWVDPDGRYDPKIHGISDNAKHSGALVNDNITLGDANGLVKDSGVAISSIVGGLNYQGTWDASTNTPTLADGTGTKGHYYRVSVAGSQDLGSGSITFAVEDFVAHNGTIWQKIDHTDQVTSVFTRQGAVVPLASDYDASQIDNDSGVAGAFVDDALDQLDTDKVEQGDIDTSITTHAGLPNAHHSPPPATFPINCSQGSNSAGNQTLYCGPQGEFTTEAEAQIRMEKSEVLRLTINTTGNTLNTNSTLQVRKNGIAAGAAITINATTPGRQTLVLSQSFADGDLFSVELVLGGTVGQRLDVRELIVIAKAVA